MDWKAFFGGTFQGLGQAPLTYQMLMRQQEEDKRARAQEERQQQMLQMQQREFEERLKDLQTQRGVDAFGRAREGLTPGMPVSPDIQSLGEQAGYKSLFGQGIKATPGAGPGFGMTSIIPQMEQSPYYRGTPQETEEQRQQTFQEWMRGRQQAIAPFEDEERNRVRQGWNREDQIRQTVEKAGGLANMTDQQLSQFAAMGDPTGSIANEINDRQQRRVAAIQNQYRMYGRGGYGYGFPKEQWTPSEMGAQGDAKRELGRLPTTLAEMMAMREGKGEAEPTEADFAPVMDRRMNLMESAFPGFVQGPGMALIEALEDLESDLAQVGYEGYLTALEQNTTLTDEEKDVVAQALQELVRANGTDTTTSWGQIAPVQTRVANPGRTSYVAPPSGSATGFKYGPAR